MMTIARDQKSTTGIGSLPHHNLDAALEFSFKMGIPFLPQIPIRNPWEFMVAQALESLPGMQVEEDGSVSLNVDIWHNRAHELNRKLTEAFSRNSQDLGAFDAFEPGAAISGSWQPFLWELQERGIRLAKMQIAGPMTAQWALRLKDGSPLDRHPDLSSQVYRLVLARSIAMVRRFKSLGIQPLLFLDEPGLYGLSLSNPKHVLGLQELKLAIQTLRKEGALVGLHCCSNTDWSAVFSLPLNYLSIDTTLSLKGMLTAATSPRLEEFIFGGGKLSLGVIPTTRSPVLQSLNTRQIFDELVESFGQTWTKKPDFIRKVLCDAIYTPACGLAFHSVSDAELVLETLLEFYDLASASLFEGTAGTA